MGVKPAGKVSVTPTVPLVEIPPLLPTVNVKLPVDPRVNGVELALLVRVRLAGATVPTVTELLAVPASPPLAVAVFVNDCVALNATSARTVIAG